MTPNEQDPQSFRRRFDEAQQNRLDDFSKVIQRLQSAFENHLKVSSEVQATQAAMLERITAFNERFVEHDERESEDRVRILDSLALVMRELNENKTSIARHEEQISTLKQWSLMLAAALGSLATGCVGWVISHLQQNGHF